MAVLRNILCTITTMIMWSVPVFAAEPEQCINAPTPACVAELGLEIALTTEYLGRLGYGVGGAVIAAEITGAAGVEDALATILTEAPLLLNKPDAVAHRYYHFGFGDPRTSLLNAPKTMRAFADGLIFLERRISPDYKPKARALAARLLVHLGDRKAADALLKDANTEVFAAYQQMIANDYVAQGDFEALRAFVNAMPESNAKSEIILRLSWTLRRNQHLAEAQYFAAQIKSNSDRSESFQSILERLAQEGRFEEATVLANYMRATFSLNGSHWLRNTLEETYARMGDEKSLRAFLKVREVTLLNELRRDWLGAILAAAKGDLDSVFEYLDNVHYADGRFELADYSEHSTVTRLARAYIAAGHRDLRRFVEYGAVTRPRDTSDEKTIGRIESLAAMQAKQGDIKEAMFSFDRATFIQDQILKKPPRRLHNSARLTLEKEMVARGMSSEAVRRAYERRDAIALSALALALHQVP